MTIKGMSGFLSAGLCIAVLLSAGLAAAGAVDLSNSKTQAYSVPQNAQERADLFKLLHDQDHNNSTQSVQDQVSSYSVLQNPYSFEDPQAALEQKNTAKELQKWNNAYYGADNPDNWYYWTGAWLNDQDANKSTNASSGLKASTAQADIYSALDNPYALNDPQANLEQKNTAKELQNWNNAYYGSSNPDNWYYWTNIWLNE